MKTPYKVLSIDAWGNSKENSWYWNKCYTIAEGKSGTKAHNMSNYNHRQSIGKIFRKHGIIAKRGKCYLYSYDGSIWELRSRKTHEPLYAIEFLDE